MGNNKIKKIFKITCISLICVFVAFIILEITAYYANAYRYKKERNDTRMQPFVSISSKNLNLKNYETKLKNHFRKPNGLNYKTSPIVIFGCSYAYGDNLNANQTFDYKLSKLLKRPVYNRALNGQGLGFMYFQSLNDNFYKEVPPADTVFYIMMDVHYRRMLINKFDPIEDFIIPNYDYNYAVDKLTPKSYNKLFTFINGSYFLSTMRMVYVNSYIQNPKNWKKLAYQTLAHIEKTKEELEKHWNKKIKFNVIFYNMEDDILEKKLNEKGIKTINLYNLTNEDLSSTPYVYKNHPSEEAWDLLTPLIIEEAKRRNSL